MFDNLFKKPESAVKPIPSTIPQPLEEGKEICFRDEKTGEFIYQRAISSDQKKACYNAMQENGMLANQFITLNRQRISINEQINDCHKKIIESEKRINDVISKIREELKLDRRWEFNMQLGCLQKREPPTG